MTSKVRRAASQPGASFRAAIFWVQIRPPPKFENGEGGEGDYLDPSLTPHFGRGLGYPPPFLLGLLEHRSQRPLSQSRSPIPVRVTTSSWNPVNPLPPLRILDAPLSTHPHNLAVAHRGGGRGTVVGAAVVCAA